MTTVLNQYQGESIQEWEDRILLGIAKNEIDMTYYEAGMILGILETADKIEERAQNLLTKEKENKEAESDCRTAIESQAKYTVLENKKREISKEKVLLRDERNKLNRQIRNEARAENITNQMIENIKDYMHLYSKPLAEYAPIDSGDNEAVLLLSDWHIGQMSQNLDNTFNDVELQKRVMKLVNDTIAHCRTHKAKKLHVFVLGDIINGLIHVTTRINNQENVTQQTSHATVLLTKIFVTLSQALPVEIYFSRGNHDRISANKKEEIFDESFFDIIATNVRTNLTLMNTENIHFNDNLIDPEIISTEVAGHVCFAAHGHKDKPTKVAEKLPTFMGKIPEFIFLGHYHSGVELDCNGIEVIVNGSLCGTDSYAVSLRRKSHVIQKLMIINKDGRLCTYNIELS